jgi:hypothetical protein
MSTKKDIKKHLSTHTIELVNSGGVYDSTTGTLAEVMEYFEDYMSRDYSEELHDGSLTAFLMELVPTKQFKFNTGYTLVPVEKAKK